MKNKRAEFLKYGWLFAAFSVSAWLLIWFQFGKFYWGSVVGIGFALVLLGIGRFASDETLAGSDDELDRQE